MNALPEKQKEVMQALLSMIDTAGHEEALKEFEGVNNWDKPEFIENGV
jgi:hypothetical protein